MTRSITSTADEALIDEAREAARESGTTLNEQFRLWLDQYTRERRAERGMEGLRRISQCVDSGGRKFPVPRCMHAPSTSRTASASLSTTA